MVFCYGYSAFKTPFDSTAFIQDYIILMVDPCLFIFWKVLKKTKFVGKYEADLVWERPTIDAYEATFIDKPIGFWREMGQLVGIGKQKGGNDKRIGSISN
jgi:amino acid transporter